MDHCSTVPEMMNFYHGNLLLKSNTIVIFADILVFLPNSYAKALALQGGLWRWNFWERIDVELIGESGNVQPYRKRKGCTVLSLHTCTEERPCFPSLFIPCPLTQLHLTCSYQTAHQPPFSWVAKELSPHLSWGCTASALWPHPGNSPYYFCGCPSLAFFCALLEAAPELSGLLLCPLSCCSASELTPWISPHLHGFFSTFLWPYPET